MKRNLSETLPRPTAGCLSVPLFNQKRRSRLPLTSNPPENEFCRTASNEFHPAESLASPSMSSGNSGNSDGDAPNYIMSAGQNSPWSRQGQLSNRPAASSAGRGLAPLTHPSRTGNVGPQMGQPRSAGWQGPSAQPSAKPCSFPDGRGNVQYQSQPSHTYVQSGQQSVHRQPGLQGSFRPQQPQRPVTTPPPHPPTAGGQWQDSTCVSVRPASSSEQRNAQESVRASDAEMRRLLQSFSEI